MKQYLWAGTETTALTLAWTLYLLSQHPEALERIRAEARAVCGDRDPAVERGAAARLHSHGDPGDDAPVPADLGLIRIAADDDVIERPSDQEGDKVVICTYVMHHSPKYWEEPEKFDPERFAPERPKKRVKYSYLPFAAGKRACIGGRCRRSRTRWPWRSCCAASPPNMRGPCRRRSTRR